MKIVILGANGQLGRELAEILQNKVNLKLYKKKEKFIENFCNRLRSVTGRSPHLVVCKTIIVPKGGSSKIYNNAFAALILSK